MSVRGRKRKEKERDLGEKEGVEREKEEDCRRLDVEGKKDEMELGEDSKGGGRERKKDVDWIWEDNNRRAMAEIRKH